MVTADMITGLDGACIPALETPMSRRYLRIAQKWCPTALSYFEDWDGRPNCGHFFGGVHWYGIETAVPLHALAAVGTSPEYDENTTGLSIDSLREVVIKAIRYLCFTHDTGPEECLRPNTGLGMPRSWGTKWGERGRGFFPESQCGGTVANMTSAALMLQPYVDDETRTMLAGNLPGLSRTVRRDGAEERGIRRYADGGERVDGARPGGMLSVSVRTRAGGSVGSLRPSMDVFGLRGPAGPVQRGRAGIGVQGRGVDGEDVHHAAGLHGREPRNGSPGLHRFGGTVSGQPGTALPDVRKDRTSGGLLEPSAGLRCDQAADGCDRIGHADTGDGPPLSGRTARAARIGISVSERPGCGVFRGGLAGAQRKETGRERRAVDRSRNCRYMP